MEYVCEKAKIDHQADLPFSKGFTMLADQFELKISKLMSLVPIMFISHSKSEEQSPHGVKFQRILPEISGAGGKFVLGACDIIGHVKTDPDNQKKRVIFFQNSDYIAAGDKSRLLDPKMEFDYALIRKKMEERCGK